MAQARLALALPAQKKTPAAYTHGNSLCENTLGQVREPPGTLMRRVQQKASVQLTPSSSLWNWAMRRPAWILNRFAVAHKSTPFKLVYNKVYRGKRLHLQIQFCPLARAHVKGKPTRQRALASGQKQNFRMLACAYRNNSGVCTECETTCKWVEKLGFYYVCFAAPTWSFKSGFGGQVVPARAQEDCCIGKFCVSS